MHSSKMNLDEIKSLYWDKSLSLKEIADKLGISFWSVYNFMNRNNIPRRSSSETNYLANKDKPKFKIKENLTFFEEKLKIAGIMLYWAEGTLKGSTVDFTNSNPEMVQIFLKFLREICGVSDDRLRVYLYAYPYQNLETIKKYWVEVTGIPSHQFTKPYVRTGNSNLSDRKLPFGLIHIRYNDKRLLELIRVWIEEYKSSSLKWAGTQAAKGDRLFKGSVSLKGVMEK